MQLERTDNVWGIEDSGLDVNVLRRYIEEQIYTLPGTDRHRDEFTILLTGSRSFGMHTPASDVDIDVLCPKAVFDSLLRACNDAGILKSDTSFWCPLSPGERDRYFGSGMGNPHFLVNSLDSVERQFREYEDVALWIWTNAKIISDPGGQFLRIQEGFRGYPEAVLHRKIKYRYLLSLYWQIEVFPWHHDSAGDLLAAASSVINAANELLRFSFLIEGRPFPYHEKLMAFSETTKLGREVKPLFQRVTDLVVGKAEGHLQPWERLELAVESLLSDDPHADYPCLESACIEAMIGAGIDRKWAEADFDNIDELLMGRLGPPP